MNARRIVVSGGWCLAGAVLVGFPVHAAVVGDLGFSRGDLPVAIHAPPALTSAGACARCHPEQSSQWSSSRHHLAWTNPIFAEGFLAEPSVRCAHCHAPLEEQLAEILPNLPWYRSRGDGASSDPALLSTRSPEPLAEEGVSCAVCHVRGDTILVAEETKALHPVVVTPALRSSEMCLGCHQFSFLGPDGRPGTEPMQRTGDEWRAWGGKQSCQDCHMPGREHTFRGAHDVDWLGSSVRASVEDTDGGVRYRVSSQGVGHNLPTGDLFRHFTLEEQRGGAWVELAFIGRTFREEIGADGMPRKVEDRDGTLRPGVEQVFRGKGGPWRLRFHYVSAEEEREGRLPADQVAVVVAEGG